MTHGHHSVNTADSEKKGGGGLPIFFCFFNKPRTCFSDTLSDWQKLGYSDIIGILFKTNMSDNRTNRALIFSKTNLSDSNIQTAAANQIAISASWVRFRGQNFFFIRKMRSHVSHCNRVVGLLTSTLNVWLTACSFHFLYIESKSCLFIWKDIGDCICSRYLI